MASLTGKVAWVTGAGSGIGQAAAIALAKEGATVVLTGRRKEPLDETAATIKKAGGKAMVKPGDLMKAAAVTRIAADIDKKLGRCDILVNNAGLNILERSWKQLSPAGAEQVIDGNLSSAFYCTTAVLPLMRKNKGGVLIHTSSMAGRQASLLSGPAYSAAKRVVAMSHTRSTWRNASTASAPASSVRARWRRRSSISGRSRSPRKSAPAWPSRRMSAI